jgi:hypothetical protein
LAGLVIWLAAWPFIESVFNQRLVLMAAISGSYLASSAWELLRHAPQRLISQRAAVVVFSTAAIFCLLRGLMGPFLDDDLWIQVFARRWSSEMALLNMMYVPMAAVLLLSMAKERLEYESRQVALVDPLTLIPNRRAFFLDAEKLASRYREGALSCLVFDSTGSSRSMTCMGTWRGTRFFGPSRGFSPKSFRFALSAGSAVRNSRQSSRRMPRRRSGLRSR